MKALIRKTASDYGNSNNSKPESLHNYLLANRGKWVTIDTKHLFNDQFNTVDGFRIFDNHIQAIKDDARATVGKCKYCGSLTEHALPCLKHAECINYGVNDLNKNFFTKNPSGPDDIIKINIYSKNNKDFYSFYSVNDLYYRISRRNNIHFVLVNNVPYIVNGINYKHYLKANLTANEVRILLKAVKLIEKEIQAVNI
jgi:hypothetical protein